jgi:hypothetical protein
MKKRTRPRDTNQLAKSIVDLAIGETKEEPETLTYAQEFARKGGLKGGKARAEKLTAKKRSEIAKKAANIRWNKKQS